MRIKPVVVSQRKAKYQQISCNDSLSPILFNIINQIINRENQFMQVTKYKTAFLKYNVMKMMLSLLLRMNMAYRTFYTNLK